MTAETKPTSFRWHNAAQFCGALNDNMFKFLIIYGLTVAWSDTPESQVLLVVGAVFAIPFLLFLNLAGSLADRLRKNRIICGIKMAEIGVMSFGAVALASGQGWMMLAAVFLMSSQSALFSPTKFSIVPELVGTEGISKANGFMQAATFLAIICGTVMAPGLSLALDKRYALVALCCVAIAAIGLILARKIEETPVQASGLKSSPLVLPDIWRTLKFVHTDGFLTLAVWSSAYFLMIASFVQLNIISYGREHLQLESQEQASFLFLAVALGIGLGSIFAGKVSARSIEFGVVPIGALLLMGSSLALWAIPVGAVLAGGVVCLFMGFGAGLFIVPVQSFLQYRSPPDRVGEVVAASGWLSWVGVLFASGLLFLCTAVLKLTAAQSFLLLAGFIAVMTVIALATLPDFFVRFVILFITRVFYRVRSHDLHNLPAQGPALVVSNHVSLMDAIWITSVQQRRIRFLMSRQYIENSPAWMRVLLKLGGVVPIHEDDNPKAILKSLQEARALLDDGWLVCIFAEGHLSRTGHLLPFKPGFERIVRKSDIPIVPVYIHGGFGSYASYAHGEPQLLHRGDFRREVTVSFGEQLPSTSTVAAVQEAVEQQAHVCDEGRKELRCSAGRRFVRSARKHWSRKAIADSSGREFTYGRTLTAALLLKQQFQKELNADPNEVGVLLPPSVPGAMVNLALALDMRVAVNLNYTASPDALRSAIRQTGMRTVITARKFMEVMQGIPLPENVVYVEDLLKSVSKGSRLRCLLKAKFAPVGLLVDESVWKPDDPLTVLFSSGSTAEPKGVMLSHHNVLSNIESYGTIARARVEDNICGVLPFFHSFGYSATLWFPMLNGFSAAYHTHPLETDAISDLCTQHKSTIIVATPTFLMGYCRKIKPEAFAEMRWVCVGAEKLKPKLTKMFEKRFGVRPLEGYGATECAPVVSINIPDVDVDELKQTGAKEGSIGRPLPGVCTRVVNPDTFEAVATGEEGLLLIKGANVMTGYLNNQQKTDEVLQDGWYNTGDIVRMDEEGFITITDRLARFSKLGGEMVSHTAVEQAIQEVLGCQPNQLAVTGIPDERKGERLVAVYDDDLGDKEVLAEKVRQSDMPKLWQPTPRDWKAVEELPLLGSGKLDLKALKEVAAAIVKA